uniref:Chitin-binding type-2 domain-containing protein n=1 Tax=Parastrongyloides trichosuri TaxID=131310 RepID=A0A0N4Z0S3_PARTI
MFFNKWICLIFLFKTINGYGSNSFYPPPSYGYDQYLDQYRDPNFNTNYHNNYKPQNYQKFKIIPLNYLCSGYSYQRFNKIELGKCNQYYVVCNFVYNSGVVESCGEGYIFDQHKGCILPSHHNHKCIDKNRDDKYLAMIQLAEDVKYCNQGAGIYRGYTGNNYCSREILICTDDRKPIPILCPPGFVLHFQPMSQDLGKKFECIKKKQCEYEMTNKVTPVTMEMMVRYCQLNNGYYYHHYGKNDKVCRNWYINCATDSIREQIFCPPDQIFDPKIGFCRRKEYTDQCVDKKICTKENLWKFFSLGLCKDEYVYCYGEIPRTERCHHHHVFDPYQGRCVDRKHVEACKKHDPNYPLPPLLTNEKCEKSHVIKLSCSEILKCRHGVYQKFVCPHFTRYSKSRGRCVIDKTCKKYNHIDTCIEGEIFHNEDCKSIVVCKNGNFIEKNCNNVKLNPMEYGECDKCYRDKHYNKQHDSNNGYQNNNNYGMEQESCNDGDIIPGTVENQYYYCHRGYFHSQTCKDNEKYDHEWRMCKPKHYNNNPPSNDNYQLQVFRCIDIVSPIIPDHNDCSKFYMCVKGNYITVKCPKDTIFNPKGSFNYNNICIRTNICPLPLNDRPCHDKEKLMTKDCDIFYECRGHRWKKMRCKNGRYFDGQKCSNYLICPNTSPNHPSYPNLPPMEPLPYPPPMEPQPYPPPMEPQPYPSPMPPSPYPPPRPEPYCREGSSKEHEIYCNRVYKCVNGIFKTKKCIGESVYSWVHRDCITDTTYCGDKKICKENQITASMEVLLRSKQPLFDIYSVTQYFICFNNQWLPKKCKHDFYFDIISKMCLKKNYNDKPYPPIPPKYDEDYFDNEKPNGNNVGKPNNYGECIESGGAAGYKGDDYDCTKFYQCAHGKWVQKQCPPGTAWNQKITTCDHKRNVKTC